MSAYFNRKFLKRPDAVLEILRRGYQWTEENMKTIAILAIIFFLTSSAWVTTNYFASKKQQKGLSAFYLAEKDFDKKRGDVKTPEALEETLADLKKIPVNFPESPAALLAYLKIGDAYADQKKFDAAANSYQEALKNTDQPLFRILLSYNLGYMYELMEKYDEAIDYFKTITAMNKTRVLFWSFGYRPNIFWLAEAYFGMGRCFEKSKRYTEAQSIYQRVMDEFPDSQFSDKAQSLLILLESA